MEMPEGTRLFSSRTGLTAPQILESVDPALMIRSEIERATTEVVDAVAAAGLTAMGDPDVQLEVYVSVYAR